MLARSSSSPPALRLNLQRPKPLLMEFLKGYRPTKILAFDSEGYCYFDCRPDTAARQDNGNEMNWPLKDQAADLEQDLQLRDTIFPRHISLIRQGYLARRHASPLGDGDVLHIDGEQALKEFLTSAEALQDDANIWILVENCHASPGQMTGFKEIFCDTALPASIWTRPNVHMTFDCETLAVNFQAAANRLAINDNLQNSKAAEAQLTYNLLRNIQHEDSTLLERFRQSLYLTFMYGTANLLRRIAPKRREKLLRSARKRDPEVNDHRFINKFIRSYQQRLQLQNRLIEVMLAKGTAFSQPPLSVIIDARLSGIDQQLKDFRNSKFVENLQLVILIDSAQPNNEDDFKLGDKNKILILKTSENVSFNAAITAAIAHCTGEYILFADAYYTYHPHLLAAAQRYLASFKDALILYTDEDEIASDGSKKNPKYKPDFNRDLFYNTNYLGAPVLIKTQVIRSLAQDIYTDSYTMIYAATLRAIECGGDAAIQHLDMILASRKAVDPSEYRSKHAAVLKAHLAHIGHEAVQLIDPPIGLTIEDAFLLDWSLDIPGQPLVSIIIPTFNQLNLTRNAVMSIIEKSRYRNFEILLIDNNSDEPEFLKWLSTLSEQHGEIRILRDERPFNFSAINNAAFCHAQGDIIALVNNDIEVVSEVWLEEMVSQAARVDIGCVGAKLLYPNGQIQHAGVNIDLVGDMHHLMRLSPSEAAGYMDRLGLQQNYLAVTGACLFLKRELYAAVGGLNQIELTIGCSDIDICLKVQALGLRNLWSPRTTLIHYESISRGLDISGEKRARAALEHAFMIQRWNMVGAKDPFYNAAIDS